MPKLITKLAIFNLTLSLLLPSFVFAQETTEFNPNYLISDEEMQSWQTMSQEDIQAFLVDNGGYLSKLRIEDVSNTPRTVANIIYRAAETYQINAKYLLVKLQKEQSLITEDFPTQKQLDWATGYGVCDSCSMNDPVIQKHKGFGTQVDSAAGIIRWYYDNMNNYSWIKKANVSYQIDNTSVRPLNNATAFLYTYTPHIQGNKNFWTLWQKWFSQFYPDGSLVKSNNDSTVYLLEDGKRRAFKSLSALVSRYDPKLIITVPTSEITRYPEGKSIAFSNYSILKHGEKFYLLDYDTIRPFANANTVRALGYNPDEFIDVNLEDIAGYPVGSTITTETTAPTGELIRLKENNQLYFVKDGIYHAIFDDKIAEINYPGLKAKNIALTDFNKYVEGEPILVKDGTLIGIIGFNNIYVIENGQKRHIASEEVFNGLGYKWSNIVWLNNFAGGTHETGQAVYYQKPYISNEGTVEPGTTNDKMVSTPLEKTVYIGPQYQTPVDTYLVADYESGNILASKNPDTVRPTASMVKPFAAYQLLENGLDLNKIITYDPIKHYSDYNHYRLSKGEMVRVNSLLDAMLVSSLNTPAVMLVDASGQKMSTFVKNMNDDAKKLGFTNTTFADASGVDVKNQTTARDYLGIFTYVLKNTTISEYLAKKNYTYKEILDNDGKPNHYDENSNLLMNQAGLPYKILASKTGYLDEAGANLTMLIQRPSDGKKFVVITMGNPDYDNRFYEPREFADWVINTF